MNVSFNFNWDIVSTIISLLAYGLIVYFAYKQYRKQTLKPKVWKLIVVIFVGLFSFSFEWPLSNTVVKLAILPLGVWLLYFVCSSNKLRWQKYRSFAWLGFWSNYVLAAATLITIPIHSFLYPIDKPATHIANASNAYIINLHPSAEQVSLHTASLKEQLSSMELASLQSDQWYYEIQTSEEEKKERFPYLLAGVESKWGSSLSSAIYVEQDGKGLLISLPNKQLYYRLDTSLFDGGDKR